MFYCNVLCNILCLHSAGTTRVLCVITERQTVETHINNRAASQWAKSTIFDSCSRCTMKLQMKCSNRAACRPSQNQAYKDLHLGPQNTTVLLESWIHLMPMTNPFMTRTHLQRDGSNSWCGVRPPGFEVSHRGLFPQRGPSVCVGVFSSVGACVAR